MLEEALRYHALGLCIIPIKPRKKQPACRSWSQYQTNRPSEGQLRKWFGTEKNLAVVCGPVSGGLIVRDFDDMEAYERWASENPSFAQTLPTVETGRPGRHVYCRSEIKTVQDASGTGAGIIDFGDGELRAANGYCLIPPSVHPSGFRYRWLNPIGDQIPKVDLYEAGFLNRSNETESNRASQKNTEDNRSHERGGVGEGVERRESPKFPSLELHKKLKSNRDSDEPSSIGDAIREYMQLRESKIAENQIETAIMESLPKHRGQRNKLVFELARGLKAVATISDADARDLKPYVQKWHQLALPVIGTQAFEETWIDFLRGWSRVKFPKGTEPITKIFERAIREALPHEAAEYEQTDLKLLVSLCRELQRHAGEGPFYLSSRTAGRLIGKQHTTVWRWLFLLESDRLLEVVQRGSQKTRKATRYRYLGKLEQ